MDAAGEPVGQGAVTLGNANYLGLAAVLPALVGFAVWRYYTRRKRVAAALGDSRLLARLGGGDLARFPTVRLVLLTLAAIALGFAASEPRWGMRDLESRTQSRSIVFALDISKSMYARDLLPNRLERERVLARRILRELASDRIGLVVFAGRAYILSPLTTDHGALQLYVDALDPEMVSQGGSSVASALGQAVDLARGPTGRASGTAVVLMTDGEALEEKGSITQAIRQANRFGVVVHTVGIGTEEGARIPEIDPRTRQVVGYKTDPYGEVVVTKLDEKSLTSIAAQTGGKYFRLDQAGATTSLVRELRQLERSTGEQRRRTEQKDQSLWFVLAALLLIVADYLLARPRTKERRALPVRRLGTQANRVAAVLILLSLVGWGIGQVERGNRHYRAGRYAEAVREYEAALKDGVDTPDLHYNLGTALLQLGREMKLSSTWHWPFVPVMSLCVSARTSTRATALSSRDAAVAKTQTSAWTRRSRVISGVCGSIRRILTRSGTSSLPCASRRSRSRIKAARTVRSRRVPTMIKKRAASPARLGRTTRSHRQDRVAIKVMRCSSAR
jgi:Ca-activated chloride channel family protein